MVEIRPFKGIRFTKKAGKLEDLVAQPYDKITEEMQEMYYAKSAYNYCRLTLPIEENRYEISKQRVEKWFSEEIFKQDEKPGFYVYFQDFELFGKSHIRKGFFAAVKLHHFKEEIVLPHEWTHKGPKIDRLNMLVATQKFLEPGFMLYNDPEKTTIKIFDEIAKAEPEMDVIDNLGVRNRVWKINDPKLIKTIQDVFEISPGQIVIADGHHRYETACSYRDELRKTRKDWSEDDAANFRMTLLVAVQDEGLTILPTHRVLDKYEIDDEAWKEIHENFDVKDIEKGEIQEFMDSYKQHAFTIYTKGKAYGIALKDSKIVDKYLKEDHADSYKTLDVVIVREVLFNGILKTEHLKIDEDIFYIRWIKDALAKVDDGKATIAVIMNSTKAAQVLDASKKGERMPQKSTDFYPKMISGLVMEDISAGEKLL
ncbi:MAG: DUF1015 domain-containing protein [Candidatus Heimdallarchaeota archaeon]|nr:MAG: DUF1015 domain-containing protein [Candidatus Heimdallarchaeota archaeon]